jgi:hypothetical protein
MCRSRMLVNSDLFAFFNSGSGSCRERAFFRRSAFLDRSQVRPRERLAGRAAAQLLIDTRDEFVRIERLN